MRIYLGFFSAVICKVLSTILFSLSLYLYKPPKKDDDSTSQELEFDETSVIDNDKNHLCKNTYIPQDSDVTTQL